MENHITWTKGMFESNYQLFANGQIKGSLFFDTWKNEARAIGGIQNYLFSTAGFMNPVTKIYAEDGTVLGVINYNSWKTSANVIMSDGSQYTWNFSNSWRSKWIISNYKEKLVTYQSSSSSGIISSNNEDELMLLTGLFIREYFTRIFIFLILIIVFVPIISRHAF